VSKRLLMLEKLTREGSRDAFHWYALALEYAGTGRLDDALATFGTLRSIDAGYVPMYLMCGTMLGKAGRFDEARAWLSDGVEVARKKGDQHALGELEEALEGVRDATER
jgi:tetratricopeptide (TPR) repeat protein